jgi:hypothetical protein
MPIDIQCDLSPEPPACAMAFVIGRDDRGHWLAGEAHGLAGGLFSSREAALRYATAETHHREGAVQLVIEPLALTL